MTERSIFLAALEIDDLAERAAYVARVCEDAGLRGQVEALLKAHGQPGEFMARPAPALIETVDQPPSAEGPGATIGPYRLMEQIGEGGMGLVFVAEQSQPIRRQVALKVIKPGMDTRQVIARFEAERQALALMEHPNIAKVLDVGTTDGGRPYFVMELIKGVPITEYCDAAGLPLRDRLGLFVQVCQAVQHAHQKGVIHRDLKPSNVLVAPHDGVPVVKLIDFGVAKALGQSLTEKTIYTRFAQMIGTPLYMSPEQAEINQLDVDTRSDVYSLGVLLYELLTGATPFDSDRFRKAAFDEIRRIIREEDPPRPSTRLTTHGATLTAVSARRGADPARLSQLVRGELDWIVMRCLEKDRARRYETVAALAKDVQRYLADEPIEARPASAWYRASKTYRRNRAALTVAAGFATLLVAALVLVTLMWRAERTARAEADVARREAEARAREVEQAAERMNRANAALDLGGFHAHFSRWAAAEAEYTRAAGLRPDHSQVFIRRGDLYAQLALWNLVAADYARAFAIREPETPRLWYLRALLYLEGGDEAEYRRACRGMLEWFDRTVQGPVPAKSDDVLTRFALARTCGLGPAGAPDADRLLRLSELSAEAQGAESWVPLYIRGTACYRARRDEEAVRLLRLSLQSPTAVEARALNFPVLALAQHHMGKADEARKALQGADEALDRWAQAAFDRQDQSVPALIRWDWVELQVLYREAHRLIEQADPPVDPRLHVIRGRAFAALGRTDRAESEFARALRLAPNDPKIREACAIRPEVKGRPRERNGR